MSFDNLWEKYGKQITPQSTEPKNESIKQEKRGQQQYEDKKEEKIFIKNKIKDVDNKKNNDQRQMTGVFGGETTIGNERRKRRKKRNWDLSIIRNWPWIDIIFITITVIMIISVIMNYEKVTTAIFSVLFPVICNFVYLFLIVGIIVFLIWWFTRRRRHRRW